MVFDRLSESQRAFLAEAVRGEVSADDIGSLLRKRVGKRLRSILSREHIPDPTSPDDGDDDDLMDRLAGLFGGKSRLCKKFDRLLTGLIPDRDMARLENDSLERTVRARAGVTDFVPWAMKFAKLRGQICRIEDPRDPRNALGTGFLVAPDLVMTNYHVVELYIDRIDPKIGRVRDADELYCRFDYARDANGAEFHGIRKELMKPDWLVHHSKYSRVDPGDRGGEPQTNEMDYALLRLAEPMGAGERGFVGVSTAFPSLQPDDIVFIVQHPKGDPLKMAVGQVLANNPSATRVRYDANTEGGSSGSPCFDANLNLVAIHHAGDPDWKRPAEYNQGIPIAAVIRNLTRQPVRFWDQPAPGS